MKTYDEFCKKMTEICPDWRGILTQDNIIIAFNPMTLNEIGRFETAIVINNRF